MRIAICDDEKNIRELIGNKVAKQYPEADIVFFQSGEELLLSDKHVDILFLDIHMSGKKGMETARELRKKDKSVILIFVTAVEEYVFQAFDVGAFNYIVKPIDDTKFVDVLCRAVDEWHSQDTNVREPEANYVMINNGGVHTKAGGPFRSGRPRPVRRRNDGRAPFVFAAQLSACLGKHSFHQQAHPPMAVRPVPYAEARRRWFRRHPE